MKILGGKLKGRNFYMPVNIRPTQNIIRKAPFDILGDISGLEFLELFSGTGAVALEAFSRGANAVTLIEKDPVACDVIRKNFSLLGLEKEPRVQLIEGDVFIYIKELTRRRHKFDIVFLDPPFELGLAKKALKTLGAYDILSPNCFIIIQCERRETLPEAEGRFLLVMEKRYGTSCLTLYAGQDQSNESTQSVQS